GLSLPDSLSQRRFVVAGVEFVVVLKNIKRIFSSLAMLAIGTRGAPKAVMTSSTREEPERESRSSSVRTDLACDAVVDISGALRWEGKETPSSEMQQAISPTMSAAYSLPWGAGFNWRQGSLFSRRR